MTRFLIVLVLLVSTALAINFDTLVQQERLANGKEWDSDIVLEIVNVLYLDIIQGCARRVMPSFQYRALQNPLRFPAFRKYADAYSYNVIAREIAKMSAGRIQCTVTEWSYEPSIECRMTESL